MNHANSLLEAAIGKIAQIVTEHGKSDKALQDRLLEEVRLLAASIGFSPEFRYWLLICGIFNVTDAQRNILRAWKDYEKIFITLVQQDGKIGIRHLLQSIIQFFVNRFPAEMMKFAGTFMKLMYDQEVFSEEFIIKWHGRKAKLDKNCALYDRSAEKTFRAAIEAFVNWLQ